MAMPRRVPVPVQRATAPMASAHGSYSDPAIGQGASAIRVEASDEDDGAGDVLVDVIPQPDAKSYKVQTLKPNSKGGESSSSGRDSERKRRPTRSRRKP
jgi:hypothetical protein